MTSDKECPFKEYSLLFKALSDETRLRIFSMLSNEELCACDILANVDITQPTLSYHMKILIDSKLVHGRKDGSWMRYTLNGEKIEEMQQLLENIKNMALTTSTTQTC